MSLWIEPPFVIAVPMVLLWLASVRLRDVTIVDGFWGAGFAAVALWTCVRAGAGGPRAVLLTGLVVAWGLRLTAYLLWRNTGGEEDRRYQNIRAGYGDRFWWVSLFVVFGFQGLVMWIVSLPVQWTLISGDGDMTVVSWLGWGVGMTGLLVETLADAQLARFKADPASRGQVMDRGLWRYSRHPNYFGDCLMWWGIFVMGVGDTAYLITAVGPVVMTIMLLRVSGVALLERDIGQRRPEYEAYIRRTSAFIPWPPTASDDSN